MNEGHVSTVSTNYIDVRHEYDTPLAQEGFTMRRADVWYALRPSLPTFHVMDAEGNKVEDVEVSANLGWTLGQSGNGDGVMIFDRDDIVGLRKLLDALDLEFDRVDMERLTNEFGDEPS